MRVPNFFSHLQSRIWKNRTSFFFTEYFLNDQHDMTHIFFHEDIGSFPTPKEQLIVNLKILYISLCMKRTYFPPRVFPQEGASYTAAFLVAVLDRITVGGLSVWGWGSRIPCRVSGSH